ncbi:SDR family NAD(P)-dependent oxidoreductase [Streptomyces sp. NRRL F-4489]|uniref:SDR family NAD(P)-dependent oxidoreductase n=1 Tax=Streptomyces sp. NRRL F-4489 TaxID=1609095 RepID=UPI00099E39C3|nr:SDR family NAD(P)-dependent oxidoreductase [Streptomyces sp. NRRL F-4489]
MPKALVVVGAGPGLGMGVARAFGRHGFRVGLIARNEDSLTALVGTLTEQGVPAAAFPADIRDRAALAAALTRAAEVLGPIDVLEYSPSPSGPITHAAGTTVAAATDQFTLHVLGAVTAVEQVLPGMLARGAGTLLLTTGVSATVPAPFLANVGLAMAGLHNWAHALHTELGPQGVHVATVTIASPITAGDPVTDPDAIGARYYRLYGQHDRAEEVIGDVDAFRALVAAQAASTPATAVGPAEVESASAVEP